MQLRFTKGAGKFDLLRITRADKSEEVIECPKQRIIPHDMVHFAVEKTLHARGFLSRVGQGEAGSFQMQGEQLSDGVERLVEVVQGDQWSGGSAQPHEILELYRVTCDARKCPPLELDADAVLAIKGEIERLTALWERVPVAAHLELEL